MAIYTVRVQTVLSEKQFAELAKLAEERDKPISVLVREAVEKVYLEATKLERRQAALDDLLAMQAPVVDWKQMEEEIGRGASSDQ